MKATATLTFEISGHGGIQELEEMLRKTIAKHSRMDLQARDGQGKAVPLECRFEFESNQVRES